MGTSDKYLKMSLVGQLDSVISQLDALLSSSQDISALPIIDQDDSKTNKNASSKKIPKIETTDTIDPITGWYIDAISKRPINPKTKQALSKNEYKKLKKKQKKKKKKTHQKKKKKKKKKKK